ncbi:MAG: DUF599 domain-containing protein [Litoreibacter sp.]|uniref:DUF599 domain-containing protein n=1 Tax=Litoreibacter sp. TaxID=1969459 RepID=UPI00329863CA
MNVQDHLTLLTPLDALAVALLVASWFIISWWIERPNAAKPSVTILMIEYRREWMRQMVTRDPRIFDAAVLADLRQGTSFFASGCMIAIGGVLAVIGNTDQIQHVASDLTLDNIPSIIWQFKLLTVALFLTYGFLKFVWSNRLFGYCAVVMASVPNDTTAPTVYERAEQAADINIRAAWNFNRGLRAIYYSLGALAWLMGPIALLISATIVTYIIWQREFASIPRSILIDGPALPKTTEETKV